MVLSVSELVVSLPTAWERVLPPYVPGKSTTGDSMGNAISAPRPSITDATVSNIRPTQIIRTRVIDHDSTALIGVPSASGIGRPIGDIADTFFFSPTAWQSVASRSPTLICPPRRIGHRDSCDRKLAPGDPPPASTADHAVGK